MSLSRRSLVVLVALTLLPGALFLALRGNATAQLPTPVVASDNVKLLTTLPGTAAISGVFSPSAPYFYVSGLDSISVIDVKDPRAPRIVGKLPNAVFENEAITYGERPLPGGGTQRFVLVGNDLGQATAGPNGLSAGRVGGRELIVVDVTDPASPKIIGRTPSGLPRAPQPDGAITTSTHTVACMNAACTVAYSAGDGRVEEAGENGVEVPAPPTGEFSIIDLSDLTKPREVRTALSPAGAPNPIFSTGAGHFWNVDGRGIAWHTGAGGTAAFDISDPLEPLPLNATNPDGTKSPFNDFIHHNSLRPGAKAFRPGRAPSVSNGNVVLVTEEDYANEGDEVACDRAGSFQTWEVPDLDGERYRAANPANETNKGSFRVLDTINPPAESGGGATTPAGGFCSAHWFDFHPSGVVAMGNYQQGLRLIDVTKARDIKQVGFFTGGGSEVWDAYWAPQRSGNGAIVPGERTNVIYTVDAARGVDVFEVSGLGPRVVPEGEDTSRGYFPLGTGGGTRPGGNGQAGGGASACLSPRTRYASGTSMLSRAGVKLRGRANGRGCGVSRVQVSVGLRVGNVANKRCRFLKRNGRFTRVRSCLPPVWLNAKGTRRWSYSKRAMLPRGRYVVRARAFNRRGGVERRSRTRNLARSRARVR